MNLPQPLRSPLAATAAVVAGLLLMAIPLRQLTRPAPTAAAPRPEPVATTTPAWLTLKLLAPAEAVTLATADGTVLWSLGPVNAGDQETRLDLPVANHRAELVLDIRRPADAPESAAFLTIAPDGMEEHSAHSIGSGPLHDLLQFSW